MTSVSRIKYVAGSVTITAALVAASVWGLNQYENDDEAIVVETGTKFISLPKALPTTLYIPRLGITALFDEPLGLLPSGELSAPSQPDRVSYYQHAPTPGEIGPAVVIGYTYDQFYPAVFSSLIRLDEGDTFTISRSDGIDALFAVTQITRNIGETFSVEAVYGELPYAGIRLLACSDVEGVESAPCVLESVVFGQLIATSSQY